MIHKTNYYKLKCEALETLYLWVDNGNPYNIAAEQSAYYSHVEHELWDIVLNITIANRFIKINQVIHNMLKERLDSCILKYKSLQLDQYGLTEEELLEFSEDVKKVEEYLHSI